MSNVILLFGMPRSGTTWIGKIFDSHPQTVYYHEPDSIYRLEPLPLFPDASSCAEYDNEIKQYIERLNSISNPSILVKRPLFKKTYRNSLYEALYRINAYSSAVLGRIGAISNFPVYFSCANSHADTVSVWKSIESLGRLQCLLNQPDTKAIHIVRHPCGYISSVLRGESKQTFTSSTATAEDYGMFEIVLNTKTARQHNLTIDRLRQMQPVERLAWRWVIYNDIAHAAAGTENYYLLDYDNLCQFPVEMAKELFRFTRLDWNMQTAEFVSASVSNESDAYYSVYKDPASASAKWRNELNPQDIDRIMAIIAGSETWQYLQNKYADAK